MVCSVICHRYFISQVQFCEFIIVSHAFISFQVLKPLICKHRPRPKTNRARQESWQKSCNLAKSADRLLQRGKQNKTWRRYREKVHIANGVPGSSVPIQGLTDLICPFTDFQRTMMRQYRSMIQNQRYIQLFSLRCVEI